MLVLETVFTDGLAHLSYLIGDKTTGVAAVIDPRRDVDVYLKIAREKGVVITHILETHIHADFVSGTCELIEMTGTAQALLSGDGGAKYGFKHQSLRDKQQIELGGVILTARHTPGHTPEHMSYFVSNAKAPQEYFAVFSGDCLFADSVGRPDLLGADQAKKLAKQLYNSIHEVFLKADDGVLVYPAHGAGSPCGADIGDRLVTSIGYERAHNKALQIKKESDFIEFVLDSSPPEPRYYPRMKKINAEGPEVLRTLPACVPLNPKEFEKASNAEDVRLIDNRDMLAFGAGHIDGAMNIGPKPMLSIWAGWFVEPEEDLLLILSEPSRLEEVVREFIRVGCTKFRGYLVSGMDGWIEAGLPIEKLEQLSVHELHQNLASFQPLDVRSPEEWEKGHVPGAKYSFLPDIEENFEEIPKGKPLAVYCASGYRASIAASLLTKHGFDVRNVPGSWEAWTSAEFEVEKPKEDKKASDTKRT